MPAEHEYGITLKQLRNLMEFRGTESVEKINSYGGVQEVAHKLRSSDSTGNIDLGDVILFLRQLVN